MCYKCRKFFPPGFVSNENPRTGERVLGQLCLFCFEGKDKIKFGSEELNKKDVIKEYDIFLKKMANNSDTLKNIVKQDKNYLQ